jgi:hypothetical protein
MTLSVAIHRVLRAIAQVVPAGSRPQWRAEWEGECAFLMKRGATAPLLLRRLASALIHAAYLRWETVHMRDLWLDLRFATRTLGR